MHAWLFANRCKRFARKCSPWLQRAFSKWMLESYFDGIIRIHKSVYQGMHVCACRSWLQEIGMSKQDQLLWVSCLKHACKEGFAPLHPPAVYICMQNWIWFLEGMTVSKILAFISPFLNRSFRCMCIVVSIGKLNSFTTRSCIHIQQLCSACI